MIIAEDESCKSDVRRPHRCSRPRRRRGRGLPPVDVQRSSLPHHHRLLLRCRRRRFRLTKVRLGLDRGSHGGVGQAREGRVGPRHGRGERRVLGLAAAVALIGRKSKVEDSLAEPALKGGRRPQSPDGGEGKKITS